MTPNGFHLRRVLAWTLLCLGTLPAATAVAGFDTVVISAHNLSASGPGEAGVTRSTDQLQVCIFCHVPHHSTGQTPLWSRADSDPSGSAYIPYSSATLDAAAGQPQGSSRMCLSCHDGTIAMGMLAGGQQISSLGAIPPGRASNLSQDLSDDHPISISYTAATALSDGELVPPDSLPEELRLESGGYLECRTCHDPHNNRFDHFLVMDNSHAALCTACHDKPGWSASTHATSLALPPTGCAHCHQPHNAGGQWLNRGWEEATCLDCHRSGGTGVDIEALLGQVSSHPVQSVANSGVHTPDEDPMTVGTHVECSDCHNPHAYNGTPPLVAGGVSGRNLGVKGINAIGLEVANATYEYEICFRCHGDQSFVMETGVRRQYTEVNERERFNRDNPSFHPVVEARNGGIPGLLSGYTSSSVITCTDCHSSDGGKKAGGTGPDGPHGSTFFHLLIARYEKGDGLLPYNQDNFALCFRCHDSLDLFNPSVSGFGDQHVKHVQIEGISCAACHDPHGVPWVLGATTAANRRLVNFDSDLVDTASALIDLIGPPKSCSVSCHVDVPNPQTY